MSQRAKVGQRVAPFDSSRRGARNGTFFITMENGLVIQLIGWINKTIFSLSDVELTRGVKYTF